MSYRYPDEAHEKSGREVTTKAREREQKQQQADIQQALNAAQTPRNWDYLKYPGAIAHVSFRTSPMTMVALRSWASPQPNPFLFDKRAKRPEHVVNSSVRRKGNFTVLVIQEVTPVWSSVPVALWSARKSWFRQGSGRRWCHSLPAS